MALDWHEIDTSSAQKLRPSRPPNSPEEWVEFFDKLAFTDTKVFQDCVRMSDSACHKYFGSGSLIQVWRSMARRYRREKLNGEDNS